MELHLQAAAVGGRKSCSHVMGVGAHTYIYICAHSYLVVQHSVSSNNTRGLKCLAAWCL